VKRFVLTSSSASALIPKPNNPVTVTTETWNEETVQYAYRDPPYEEERGYPVYAAAKTLSEKEAWKFMAEKKPGFVLNAVLPNINFGASLDIANQGHPSTSGLVAELFKGNWQPLAGLPARTFKVFLGVPYSPPSPCHTFHVANANNVEYFVDVQDTALLHVAAVIHPDVKSERVFSFAEPVNGDKMLAIMRKLYPDRTFPENFQGDEDLSDIVPRQRALELLSDMGKTEGWTSLEESIRRNTADLI
jgi:nucleoside-diphosphate-sugar epimerase